ncbi:MAG: aminoglycoside phosphotransferase family protein [Nitrospinota bacterium]
MRARPLLPPALGKKKEALASLLRSALGSGLEVAAVEALPGDASDRRYYRLRLEGGGAARPQAKRQLSRPLLASRGSKKVGPFAPPGCRRAPRWPGAQGNAILMESDSPPGPEPFLNVRAFLELKGLPVPSLYGADGEEGLVLLEDSGEETLEECLRREPHRAEALYEQALELLLTLQERCTEVSEPDSGHPCRALRYAFDADTFAGELHHTRRFAFEGLLGLRAPAEEWEEDFRWLAQALVGNPSAPARWGPLAGRPKRQAAWRPLATPPLVFTHRDYHSRNLLVRPDGELALLDFQDARLGPPLYDLASLLFDAYRRPIGELSERLARRFREGSPGARASGRKDAFDRALRLAGLQRDLKAIGTFAYQKLVRGTDRYLPAIGAATLLVREHLEHLPEARGFARRLAPILDRLAQFSGEDG